MRKTIVFTLCTAMLCAVLCGCGNQRQDDMAVSTPAVPESTPMVSPMVTPDPRDGIVDDRDGVIEEDETQENPMGSGSVDKGKTTVSPSPNVTSRP